MSIAELRSRIAQLREKWPSPEAEWISSEFAPDQWLRDLWQAATKAGVRLQSIPQIIPEGRTAFQVGFDWIDHPRKAEAAWKKYFGTLAKVEIELGRIENQTSRVSGKKLGRKPGKVKPSKFERDAIKRYCDGEKLAAIDAMISNQSGAVRFMGKDKKKWEKGDTARVIRAAKKRGAIQRNENGWEIVTN